ncbi:hypothetical protein ON010_g16243 [Phytophthora cinnamomi]|nr:hypothetical protein ON010_g16243 [Phytophthora cinnamomi]
MLACPDTVPPGTATPPGPAWRQLPREGLSAEVADVGRNILTDFRLPSSASPMFLLFVLVTGYVGPRASSFTSTVTSPRPFITLADDTVAMFVDPRSRMMIALSARSRISFRSPSTSIPPRYFLWWIDRHPASVSPHHMAVDAAHHEHAAHPRGHWREAIPGVPHSQHHCNARRPMQQSFKDVVRILGACTIIEAHSATNT